MNKTLNILRWIVTPFLILLLFLLIITGIPATVVSNAITNKDKLQDWLKQSEIYDNGLEIMTDVMEEKTEQGTYFYELDNQLQDENSELSQLVKKNITPDFLEQSSNTVIDSMYDWAEGKTERPEFKIQVAKNEETLIEFLTIAFKEKMKNLPECSTNFVMPSDFDPLGSDCQPINYDLNEIEEYIRDHSDEPEFKELFEATEINSTDFKPSEETTENVQTAYTILKLGPYIIVSVILLIALILVILIPGWKKGLLVSGILMLVSGLLVLISKLVLATQFDYLINRSLDEIQTKDIKSLESTITKIADIIYFDILNGVQWWSFLFIGLGIAAIIGGVLIKGKKKEGDEVEVQGKTEEKTSKLD